MKMFTFYLSTAGRRTQFFHCIITQRGNIFLVQPCKWTPILLYFNTCIEYIRSYSTRLNSESRHFVLHSLLSNSRDYEGKSLLALGWLRVFRLTRFSSRSKPNRQCWKEGSTRETQSAPCCPSNCRFWASSPWQRPCPRWSCPHPVSWVTKSRLDLRVW